MKVSQGGKPAKLLKRTWRDVNTDPRARVGDTILPPMDRILTLPSARKAAWLFGSVNDALALPSRGWIVGHFDGVAERSDDCQVKLWSFTGSLGDTYPWKLLASTELTFVCDGALHLALRKHARATTEYNTVRAGNWILARPGTYYRALAGDQVSGVTVRWPSRKGSKEVVPCTP